MTHPPPSRDEPTEKYCSKVRTFEVHPEHEWEKGRFTYWCLGIPPVDEQPPCQVVVDGSVCGEPAPVEVHLKTNLIDSKIDVCQYHKKRFDSSAAAQRLGHTLPRAS